MSLSSEITLDFGDGEYLFKLLMPQIVELEEKTGFIDRDGNRKKRGVIALYGDLLAGLLVVDGEVVAVPQEGRASAFDAREVIRLALIGGGSGVVNGAPVRVDAVIAKQLCERYVDTVPIIKRWTAAAAILRAAVEGVEPPKKDQPVGAPAKPVRKRRSSPPK